MKAVDVIIKPILSEKSYADIANKRYTFKVAKDANKVEIRNAVEELFGVKVKQVNTSNVNGKLKRQGKTQGYTSDWKNSIDLLSSVKVTIAFFQSDV